MCHTSRSLPVAIPLAAVSCADGFIELEYTLALAKATTLYTGCTAAHVAPTTLPPNAVVACASGSDELPEVEE